MQVLVIIVQNGVPHSELGRQPWYDTGYGPFTTGPWPGNPY
jgi:hypothetical protein